ncbi:MAG: hypothetical protein ACRCZI_02605 [Cetobacterium sp.]
MTDKEISELDNITETLKDVSLESEIDVEKTDDSKPAKKGKGRGPGRPKKTPIQQPDPRLGVVMTPKNESCVVEFMYDNPTDFKKLWAFFKKMAVEKIHMAFGRDSINIYCTDHHNKSRIRAKIDCTKVTHYYCEKDLDIGLLCANPRVIMNTIDKSYSSMSILYDRDNIKRNIQIILNNEFEESHKIELIGDYDKTFDKEQFSDEDYMIKFKLGSKLFKKMISGMKSFTDQVTIKKDGPDDHLIFEYTKKDKKIKSEHIVKNNTAIELKDNLGPDDTFRTSFKVEYVEPISSSILGEHIDIYADENKPLKFVSKLNKNTIEITILTSIVDLRDTST